MDVECHKRERQWRTTLSVKDFIVPSIGRHDNNYITCVNQDCTRIKMHYVVPSLRHYERNIFLETFDHHFRSTAILTEQFRANKESKEKNFIKYDTTSYFSLRNTVWPNLKRNISRNRLIKNLVHVRSFFFLSFFFALRASVSPVFQPDVSERTYSHTDARYCKLGAGEKSPEAQKRLGSERRISMNNCGDPRLIKFSTISNATFGSITDTQQSLKDRNLIRARWTLSRGGRKWYVTDARTGSHALNLLDVRCIL